MNDVIKLWEGLDRTQARQLTAQALPVLRELRTAIEAGKTRLVIDLRTLPQPARPRRSDQAPRENVTK